MDEINNILNDKSKNDKLLIKELSIYIKNHKNNKFPVNRKFFEGIIDIILKNSEIEFNDIFFIVDDNNFTAAFGTDKNFYFNVNSILDRARITREQLKSKVGDNRIFTYYSILETIIHELTHARQDYVCDIEGNELYDSGNNYFQYNYYSYLFNHDLVLIERYANLRANSLAYEVLSYVYPSQYIKDLKRLFYSFLLGGYGYAIYDCSEENGEELSYEISDELRSALDEYNQLLSQHSIPLVNINITDDMTLYDRLYLGSKVSNEEFDKVYNNIPELVNKEGKIKSLINKL